MMKVAVYCRVSTDFEDQMNSFVSQQQYFQDYICQRSDWELYEIYADEGITGTSTQKRAAFNRMIRDAYDGRFQLILTKEVSRFSRNILDTISYTRELRAIGVGVLFVTDRIHTMEPEAEMMLAFFASLAQEESRRTSSRVTWGQTRQMERGVVFGQSMLGYDVQGGKITINPEGAALVKTIFWKYAVEQLSTTEIARYLTEKGYRTYRGNTCWESGNIVKILKNEKYIGELVQRKSYTPDFLTHKRMKNNGQVPFIMIPNHHEPIISKDIWKMTQDRLKHNNKRNDETEGHSNRYGLSGKVKCGECGSSFVGRYKYRSDGGKVRRWSCAKATKFGKCACDVGKLLRDDDGLQMLKSAIRALKIDRQAIADTVATLASEAILKDHNDSGRVYDRLLQARERICKKKESVLECYFSGSISLEEMQLMREKYEREMVSLSEQIAVAVQKQNITNDIKTIKKDIFREVYSILNGETDSDLFVKTMLHSITVFKDRHLELRLNYLLKTFYYF